MQTVWTRPLRSVNHVTAEDIAAKVAAERKARMDRGIALPSKGYKFFGSPFAPNTYTVMTPKGFTYVVTLGTSHGVVHCTCDDFARYGAVLGCCKHTCGCGYYRAQIDADGLAFARSFYRTYNGHVVVKAHTRNGRQVAAYTRRPRIANRIPDAAVEAQCAAYDALHGGM